MASISLVESIKKAVLLSREFDNKFPLLNFKMSMFSTKTCSLCGKDSQNIFILPHPFIMNYGVEFSAELCCECYDIICPKFNEMRQLQKEILQLPFVVMRTNGNTETSEKDKWEIMDFNMIPCANLPYIRVSQQTNTHEYVTKCVVIRTFIEWNTV